VWTPAPCNPTFPAVPPIRATLFGLTDRGRTRDHNEDTFLVADLDGAEAVRVSHPERLDLGERGLLFLVADGMGGAAAGELASEMAAVEIHKQMLDGWAAVPLGTEEAFAANLRRAVEAANGTLHTYANEHPEVRGMGTTATVAGVWRDRLYLAQIGDSRGYLVRDGVARQLTRDQSLTQRLVEVGELTEEEAEASERRNIILQALGPDPKVKVDLSWQQLQRGDVLLICSDGLSTVVRRDEMAAAVNEEVDVRKIAERLVGLANTNGGPDNITIVVVRFDGEGLPAKEPDEPGYHEYPQADERPSLQPTAAFPAATPPQPMPALRRHGSPTGLALTVLAVVMGLLGVVILLNR
jgi:serine/threonine protein phosphatase PrpC